MEQGGKSPSTIMMIILLLWILGVIFFGLLEDKNISSSKERCNQVEIDLPTPPVRIEVIEIDLSREL